MAHGKLFVILAEISGPGEGGMLTGWRFEPARRAYSSAEESGITEAGFGEPFFFLIHFSQPGHGRVGSRHFVPQRTALNELV